MPIVLFASMGDNITPPQQAFNWVADVYGSTEEIKARGQVIVGLMHEDIGHLGIFVSGKVAKKEHAQIVSVLKSIEALPPGLYGMRDRRAAGTPTASRHTTSRFVELRLEDVAARLNRFKREDERAVRGDERGLRIQPARLRAVRAPAGAGDVERIQRQAVSAASTRCACSAGRSPTSIPGSGGSRRRRRR